MTTRVNIYVDQGIDYSTSIDLFYSTGSEMDVLTSEFYCRGRKLYSTGNANTDIIGVVTIDDQNTLTLQFPSSTTVDKKPGKYVYDLIQVEISGTRTKIMEGLLFILPTVSEVVV